MAMITLYDDVFSPYARKVRVALYEKGSPFERMQLQSPWRERADFVDANPRAEVPALIEDGFTLYDSTIICEYLEDRTPEPRLYPQDPRLRAKCRQIEDLSDTQLDAAIYAVALVEFGRRQVNEALHEAAARDLRRLYDDLEQRLGSGPFFCGDFSLADIAVLPHVMAASFFGFPLDPARHPGLIGWIGRMHERPSVARDNVDVMEALARLQKEKQKVFDPNRVQWRSDRLEWIMKNGFAEWFMEELRAGRAFFPLALASLPARG
jgi:glutathione S-transferase